MPIRVLFISLAAGLLCETASFAQSESNLTAIAYPVAEWVTPIAATASEKKAATSEPELMARILQKVAPDSWERAGGPGTMRYEPKGYVLHVRQTPAVHAELKKFLESRLRGQVSLEMRIVQLSEKGFEYLNGRGMPWKESDGIQHALLSDIQVFQFLEMAQEDRSTHIMQAPKLTVFDGQDAKIEVGNWETFQTGVDIQMKDGAPVVVPKNEKFFQGILGRFLPTISADRKTVTVQADVMIRNSLGQAALVPVQVPLPGRLNDGAKPVAKDVYQVFIQQPQHTELKVAVVAKIPDQRTIALVAGKVFTEGRTEFGPPILSKIPYLSRLYRNQAFGRETATIVVLLTPRVNGVKEQETAHVERLRTNIQRTDDGKFPLILSRSGK